METIMKRILKILGTIAFALTFFLSSCSSSSEEATIDTGIRERLNAATGFSWKVESLNEAIDKSDQLVYSSEGYIQQLWPKDLNECIFGVYVYENVEYAKTAQLQYFPLGDMYPQHYVLVIEDPLTNYGIILTKFGEPCSVAVASTFDYVLPWSN
jgi:hypothetical protein